MATNLALIAGNLAADPELKNLPKGGSVCNFRVATDYKPPKGEKRTEFHRVTVWGKQGEACNEYLKKGSKVFVQGRLQTRSYEVEGQTKSTTEIIAHDVDFVSSAPRD